MIPAQSPILILSNLDTYELHCGFSVARLDLATDCKPCSRNLNKLTVHFRSGFYVLCYNLQQSVTNQKHANECFTYLTLKFSLNDAFLGAANIGFIVRKYCIVERPRLFDVDCNKTTMLAVYDL